MAYIRVKCDKCGGTRRTKDGELCTACYPFMSNGTRLVSIDEAKFLLGQTEAQLIQKQIDEAGL